MSITHEQPPRRPSPHTSRVRAARLYGLIVTGGAALIILGFNGLHAWNAARQEARYWTVSGQPCERLSRVAFAAQGSAPEQAFAFGGVRFAREAGAALCQGRRSAVSPVTTPVCQFTDPILIEVDTRTGAFYFAPGPGRAATVSAIEDTPTCVLASNYRDEP